MEEARTSKRFPVHLPVRLDDSTEVMAGMADNLSAAGAYLILDRELQIGSAINFEIHIPAESVGGTKDVSVRCQGRVMRAEEHEGKNGVACVIDSYEFVRDGSEAEK